MTIDFLKRCLLFLFLCLAQALVFNRIQLFGCAMPLVYVYFALKFPYGFPRWASLLWGFALGFCTDMFANTPGVASTSMTLLAFLQPTVLELFIPRDAEENLRPSTTTLGWGKFLVFALILVSLYCLVFFSLEAFNYFNWSYWLSCVGGSSLLTMLIIVALESWKK